MPKLKFCIFVGKTKRLKNMKSKVTINTKTKPAEAVRKPEGLPKVKMGTGSKLGYVSDTLFDDDLKR
jgi:hypothetical protein